MLNRHVRMFGVSSCILETPKFGLVNEDTEDLSKMLQNAAFYQGLHCLLRQKQSSGKKYNII